MNMKKVSKTLNYWADVFVIAGVFLFVVSIIGFFMDSAWCGSTFESTFFALMLSPVFRGLSVLVQNAEEQIEFRRVMDNLDEQ